MCTRGGAGGRAQEGSCREVVDGRAAAARRLRRGGAVDVPNSACAHAHALAHAWRVAGVHEGARLGWMREGTCQSIRGSLGVMVNVSTAPLNKGCGPGRAGVGRADDKKGVYAAQPVPITGADHRYRGWPTGGGHHGNCWAVGQIWPTRSTSLKRCCGVEHAKWEK